MKYASGNWTRFRNLPGLVEVDFHWAEEGTREAPYWEAMGDVEATAMEALKRYHADRAVSYVMFRHGSSTSGPFRRTARSVIRGLMRSPESTPYIVKARSIQHYSVFVAVLRRDRPRRSRSRAREGKTGTSKRV